MDIPEQQALADELLRHVTWLRGLARRLVGAEGDADDLVQETFLAALRHPPSRVRDLRPWLAQVMRNAARQVARATGRRRRREAVAALPESVPSGTELVETVEIGRQLARLVLELEEPLRTTLVRRFYEGRSAAEIARLEGIPAGTVRWRIASSLQRLRARLDRDFGSRETWCRALGPLAFPAGLAPPVAGGAGASDPRGEHGERPAEREPVMLQARVVDEAGAAVTGVRATRGSDPLVAADPDEAGRVRFVLGPAAPGEEGRVLLAAPGHATVGVPFRVAASPLVDLGTVVLPAGGRVSGRVVDAQGAPVAGADVVVANDLVEPEVPRLVSRLLLPQLDVLRRSLPVSDLRTTSGADGRFRIAGVKTGSVRLAARGPETETGISDVVEVAAGSETDGVVITVKLPANHDRIHGVVVDGDGNPVPRAALQVWSGRSVSTTTVDDRGCFDLGATAGGPVTLVANDPRAADLQAVARDVTAAAEPITLTLVTVPRMRLTVRDEAGQPVEEFAVEVWTVEHPFWHTSSQVSSAVEIDAETGSAWILPPAGKVTLTVKAPGFRDWRSEPIGPDRAGGDLLVALERTGRIEGSVWADGAPVTGARVVVQPVIEDDWQFERGGFPLVLRAPLEQEVTTDAAGRFALPLPSDAAVRAARGERFVLVVLDGERARAFGESSRWRDVRSARAQRVTIQPGGAIEGRLLTGGRRSPAGLMVAATRGDGRFDVQRVGDDGVYRFEDLAAGPWIVGLCTSDPRDAGLARGEHRARTNPIRWIQVAPGTTLHHDITLP